MNFSDDSPFGRAVGTKADLGLLICITADEPWPAAADRVEAAVRADRVGVAALYARYLTVVAKYRDYQARYAAVEEEGDRRVVEAEAAAKEPHRRYLAATEAARAASVLAEPANKHVGESHVLPCWDKEPGGDGTTIYWAVYRPSGHVNSWGGYSDGTTATEFSGFGEPGSGSRTVWSWGHERCDPPENPTISETDKAAHAAAIEYAAARSRFLRARDAAREACAAVPTGI